MQRLQLQRGVGLHCTKLNLLPFSFSLPTDPLIIPATRVLKLASDYIVWLFIHIEYTMFVYYSLCCCNEEQVVLKTVYFIAMDY